MRIVPAVFAVVSVLTFTGASAQEGHQMEVELPEACQSDAQLPEMQNMASMQAAMEGMGEANKAFIEGMMPTHDPMMSGMMADDPDVAFACAMIPHHQGAINMAEVELQYGDDNQMRQMAQMIIDAQKKEIAELTQWIEEQAR